MDLEMSLTITRAVVVDSALLDREIESARQAAAADGFGPDHQLALKPRITVGPLGNALDDGEEWFTVRLTWPGVSLT